MINNYTEVVYCRRYDIFIDLGELCPFNFTVYGRTYRDADGDLNCVCGDESI